MQKIRVLHINRNYVQGGVETFLAALTKHSDPQRFEHHMLILNDDHSFEAALDSPERNLQIHSLPKLGLKGALKLLNGMDVISTTNPQTHFPFAIAAAIAKKPIIWGVHMVEKRNMASTSQKFQRVLGFELTGPILVNRVINQVVCCTDAARDQVVQDYKWNPDKVRVIRNGIDTARFKFSLEKRKELRKALNIPENANVLGFAGRYADMKDIPNFIESARLLKERNSGKPLYFLMCGDQINVQNKELVAQLKKAGIYDSCKLLGVHMDMPQFYSAIDVLVSSSSMDEALGMALLEASSARSLCISTEAGDHKRLMKETGGISVPVKNSQALADGIQSLLDLPEVEKERARDNARSVIEKEYSVERMAREYDAVYEKAVQEHSARRGK